MDKTLKQFVLVLVVVAVLGGFVGGELSDKTFSITGATVGGVGAAVVLLSLSAYFHAQEEKKKKTELPPEVRAVFDRMLGGHPGASPPAPRVPPKPPTAPKPKGREDVFLDTAAGLLQAQLVGRDLHSSFGTLMTNTKARGYVFGFHDGLLFKMGLRDESQKDKAAALMETSYKRIFGEQAGYMLFSRSIGGQSDPEFQAGRMAGGNDIVDFADNKVPPLGLGRIVVLGMEG